MKKINIEVGDLVFIVLKNGLFATGIIYQKAEELCTTGTRILYTLQTNDKQVVIYEDEIESAEIQGNYVDTEEVYKELEKKYNITLTGEYMTNFRRVVDVLFDSLAWYKFSQEDKNKFISAIHTAGMSIEELVDITDMLRPY